MTRELIIPSAHRDRLESRAGGARRFVRSKKPIQPETGDAKKKRATEFASCTVSAYISGAARWNAGPVATGLAESRPAAAGTVWYLRRAPRSGPRRREDATEGLTTRRSVLPMAIDNPTDSGGGSAWTTSFDKDERDQVAILRQVLELHPAALTRDELSRELTGGGLQAIVSWDGVERGVRELVGTGLLHPPGSGEFIRATRPAVRYFELSGGAF